MLDSGIESMSGRSGVGGEGGFGMASRVRKGLVLKEEERGENISPAHSHSRSAGPSCWGQGEVAQSCTSRGTERTEKLGCDVILWFLIRNIYLVIIPIPGTELLNSCNF